MEKINIMKVKVWFSLSKIVQLLLSMPHGQCSLEHENQ